MDGTSLGIQQQQVPVLPVGGRATKISGQQQDLLAAPGIPSTAPGNMATRFTAQPMPVPASSLAARPAVSKPFADVAPEIQDLINTMLGIYSAKSHEDLSKVFDRFKFNCEFDLPLFFVRGADRMHVLTNLLHINCDRVVTQPRLVSVQMLDNQLGSIAVEGTVKFFPRLRHFPVLGPLLVPENIPLHVTWEIVATGDDDKIISVKETMHNLPGPPQLLRGLWGTALTTAGLPFSSW